MEQPAVNGYVVVRGNKKFLSRSGRWVRKRNKSTSSGPRRAWVHTLEDILGMSQLAAELGELGQLLPACFDAGIGYTTITGEPISYQKFAQAHR